ncbi:hypothetical protein Mal4_26080 [Maioricimonas rarisocia]|uniref:DUF1501 domain-containing protein n=1 Tax=Maioricimonas rarisocia TaxID=2528026 RepID=A0A517Z776_9PLAN|nr:DUF1501 domain-containing protein [Maioricimonas rarisocia]QDU38281.1 hypothetical protein Mal4_26080 [Maioricimonas rarisocia]
MSRTASPVRNCPGPLNRRGFLQLGALGLGGLSLADVMRLRARASGPAAPPDTSVIFVWLPGGPPHMEMYDMKPDAPSDYRGVFHPIRTNVDGLDVCELMPRHARIADKYNIVRSIAHQFADHGGGHKRFLTGRDPQTPTGFVNDAPAVGSIVARCREDVRAGVPNYISGTDAGRAGVDTYSFGAAYLGPAYVPFNVPGDPSDPKFAVRNVSLHESVADRLDDRMTLLRDFDRLRRGIDQSGLMSAMDDFDQRAASLLTSAKAQQAFDLAREPDALRDRYGRHAWGQRALLARRLVEAGCSFVTMVMEKPYQSGVPWLKQGTYNWDSHAVNCHLFDDAKVRLPIYDQAVTALVEDLFDRGLDKRVMLVVTGEFGRTPKITTRPGTQTGVMQPGRDHWPSAMSLLITGGGMRTGQVIGQTNSKGEEPKERPLTPNDLWATVYRHLGIDPEWTFPDYSGRPMPILPYGSPIEELC